MMLCHKPNIHLTFQTVILGVILYHRLIGFYNMNNSLNILTSSLLGINCLVFCFVLFCFSICDVSVFSALALLHTDEVLQNGFCHFLSQNCCTSTVQSEQTCTQLSLFKIQFCTTRETQKWTGDCVLSATPGPIQHQTVWQ